MNPSFSRRLTQGLAALVLGVASLSVAWAEPTMNQVYEAAQAGHLDQAQTMMQQVLVAHPNSAKAHFVEAELLARQGQMARAREELAQADKLEPGLPFAKPESVSHLRTQLAAPSAVTATPSLPGADRRFRPETRSRSR